MDSRDPFGCHILAGWLAKIEFADLMRGTLVKMNLRMEMELSCTFVVALLWNRRVSSQG
jgi:hypothetical protein